MFFQPHSTNCLSRDSCCTRKPQGTPTWSLTTAQLSPPPTWTALRGASPSSNWTREREGGRRRRRRRATEKLQTHVNQTQRQVHGLWTKEPNRGGRWGWTWWSHPSASSHSHCWDGRDPKWAWISLWTRQQTCLTDKSTDCFKFRELVTTVRQLAEKPSQP